MVAYDCLLADGGEGAAGEILAAAKSAGHSKDSIKRASLKLAVMKTEGWIPGTVDMAMGRYAQ
jgi:hypothetical protein